MKPNRDWTDIGIIFVVCLMFIFWAVGCAMAPDKQQEEDIIQQKLIELNIEEF